MSTSAESFLPLRPRVFAILLSLRQSPTHGYALLKHLEASSSSLRMDPGLMYRTIARLRTQRLVRETERPPDETDTRRRYYELTPLGLEVVELEARRQAAVLDTFDLGVRS